jgi:hypothetical protein
MEHDHSDSGGGPSPHAGKGDTERMAWQMAALPAASLAPVSDIDAHLHYLI